MKGNFEGMTNEQLTIYERSKQLRVKVNSVITFPGMCFLSLSLSLFLFYLPLSAFLCDLLFNFSQ